MVMISFFFYFLGEKKTCPIIHSEQCELMTLQSNEDEESLTGMMQAIRVSFKKALQCVLGHEC